MAISACVWRCTSNNTCASVAFSVRILSIPFTNVTVTGGFCGGGAGLIAGRGGALETAAAATLTTATFVPTASVPAASETFWSLATGAAETLGILAPATVTGPGFTGLSFTTIAFWVVEI